MHGIILKELKHFVVDTYDQDAWNAVVDEAGIDRSLFVPVTSYPDEYVFELVGAAAELTGESAEDLQYEFGRYVVPSLVETYGVHVDADWTGLELLENVEEYIHEALRAKNLSEFTPPGIDAERRGDDRILVTYSSDRMLCNVARGVLQGVADHYEESWQITERRCMHDGDEKCELLVEENQPAADVPSAEAAEDSAESV